MLVKNTHVHWHFVGNIKSDLSVSDVFWAFVFDKVVWCESEIW